MSFVSAAAGLAGPECHLSLSRTASTRRSTWSCTRPTADHCGPHSPPGAGHRHQEAAEAPRPRLQPQRTPLHAAQPARLQQRRRAHPPRLVLVDVVLVEHRIEAQRVLRRGAPAEHRRGGLVARVAQAHHGIEQAQRGAVDTAKVAASNADDQDFVFMEVMPLLLATGRVWPPCVAAAACHRSPRRDRALPDRCRSPPPVVPDTVTLIFSACCEFSKPPSVARIAHCDLGGEISSKSSEFATLILQT